MEKPGNNPKSHQDCRESGEESRTAEVSWDHARFRLQGLLDRNVALRTLAVKAGLSWPHCSGVRKINATLKMTWADVTTRWWYWYPKTPEDLLEVVQAALDLEFEPKRGQWIEVDVDELMRRLGLPRSVSNEVLLLSRRARNFIEDEGLTELGPLLEYLAERRLRGLPARRNLGWRTEQELFAVLDALCSGEVERMRQYFPLCASGHGICFAAAAANLVRLRKEKDRTSLFEYLHNGVTLHEVGVRTGRTRARIEQVVSEFTREIGRMLAHFPKEENRLAFAWEQGESLQDALGDELDEEGSLIVSGALWRIFNNSKPTSAARIRF